MIMMIMLVMIIMMMMSVHVVLHNIHNFNHNNDIMTKQYLDDDLSIQRVPGPAGLCAPQVDFLQGAFEFGEKKINSNRITLSTKASLSSS